MNQDLFELSINLLKLIVIFLAMVQAVPILVWLERRGSAFIQNRLGPNRVGPLGLLQLLADAVKFLFKEEFVPANAVKALYYAAPAFALIPAVLAFAAIPLSTPVHIQAFEMAIPFLNKTVTLGPYVFLWQGFDVNVGIVYVLGVSSLAAYSILMAGWGSGNKFSLMGAMRASAQIISYELALGLSIVGVILLYGTFNLSEMILAQKGFLNFNAFGYTISSTFLPNWGIFFQPIGFIIFLAAIFAESNRLPFDLAEGEAELVAGFHVEYGGFKMLLFFIGEYGHMMVGAALLTIFFLGGWTPIFGSHTPEAISQIISGHISSPSVISLLTGLYFFIWFFAKFAAILWFFIHVRWTLPRFRYDQLMDLGWKTMLPWALANTIITAVIIFIFSMNGIGG